MLSGMSATGNTVTDIISEEESTRSTGAIRHLSAERHRTLLQTATVDTTDFGLRIADLVHGGSMATRSPTAAQHTWLGWKLRTEKDDMETTELANSFRAPEDSLTAYRLTTGQTAAQHAGPQQTGHH